MAVFTSKYASGEFGRRLHNGGVQKVKFKIKVPQEAVDSTDEQVLLLKFPDDGDVSLRRANANDGVFVFEALDGGSTAAGNIGIGTVGGVIGTTLATCATTVLDGGTVNFTGNTGADIDVTGKYLIYDNTVAAGTEADGYITGHIFVDFGYNFDTDDSLV
jgi:hypothetical protein